MIERGRFRGALLGLAIGDAVGATVEFKPRGSFPPLTDMLGGGPFNLEPGRWTDDTSMALCLAESLLACGGNNLKDQCERYLRWYRQGVWSSKGYCFDIGNATRKALEHFERDGNPLSGSADPHSAGNGSIMRLVPVVLYFAKNRDQAIAASIESSRTTHQAQTCLDACASLASTLHSLLNGEKPELPTRQRDEVKGSGYVVESLEAATWAFNHSNSFEEAILNAANLGDDADTTAAITGQMAGAWYGVRGIPESWRNRCYRAAEIAALADQLYEVAINP
jgi:ADP-ribosyl-[dinitrogen reductase] hydrolase